jgi:hypothetical protein
LTIDGSSQQGMGSVSGVCSPQVIEARRWAQTVLFPPDCVQVLLQVHRAAGRPHFCLAIEVSDPHTKELLALHVDPTRKPRRDLDLPGQLAATLGQLLGDVLNPSPF